MDKVNLVASLEAANPKLPNERLLWKPMNIGNHQLELLREVINKEKGLQLGDYADLHKWSTNCYAEFWEVLWRYLDIKCSAQPSLPVVDVSKPIDEVPRWFAGAKLNYAENLLRYGDDDKVAFYYTSERVETVGVKSKTFGQLRQRVAFLAQALKRCGIRSGDRIVGYLPNFPESVELMAATASLGAVWSSTSPDFGVSGVLDRFRQIRPRIIFSVEAVSYNLKTHSHLGKLREVVQGLPDLEKVVVIPFCHDEADIDLAPLGSDKVEFFSQFVGDESGPVPVLEYEQVPFGHPLFIMFSSGTTGAPKCMVHSVGGTLLKHLCEHRIQGNRGPSDVVLYYTTIGWMMWNWAVSALALGTSLVLYDGSPLLPHAGALWDLADRIGVTVFGTSAKWLAVQEERGVKPHQTHSLNKLSVILSTGSPLMPHSYDYVYRDVKSNVLLGSISGGSDIIACFMGEISVLPVHRGEIQGPLLGCAVECWDETGCGRRHVEGRPGELVVTKPFPSMPVSFWNDDSGKLYRAAYFERFPGVWTHGDFLQVDSTTKGILMLGRSDGTLNPNGVRFGSTEIYSIVESSFPEVADSLCVAQPLPGVGERVILFLKMHDDAGSELQEDLVKRLKSKIREELSARHVPALMLPIADIPYTVNGKKVEVAVKKILSKQPVKNSGALANPESLDLFKDIPEIERI